MIKDKFKEITATFLLVLGLCSLTSAKTNLKSNANSKEPGIISLDTKYTISKVRTAKQGSQTYIVASSYEGTVLGVSKDGIILWKNPLSGFMNHDIWCSDLNNDGIDEIVAANADGTIYCLDYKGKLLWKFKKNDAPMYATTVIKKGNTAYVVCGGFDKSIYYLTAKGAMVKEIKSKTYSEEKPWGDGVLPPKNESISNFLRIMHKADGSEVLIVNGTNNGMQVAGTLYYFEPLADLPFKRTKSPSKEVIGDFKVLDINKDGKQEMLLGSSSHFSTQTVVKYDIATEKSTIYKLKVKDFGYRVAQSEIITDGKEDKYFVIVGHYIFLLDKDLNPKNSEIIEGKYAFNDIWKDESTGNIILASIQSGGSCIQILNPKNSSWKTDFINFKPKGKIESILSNTEKLRKDLNSFKKPSWEREQLPVYFMTDDFKTPIAKSVVENIKANYKSPMFLNGTQTISENWDRSAVTNEKFNKKRDRRQKYDKTQAEILAAILPEYKNYPGVAFWGGHGNDPYFYNPETMCKILDGANGKKTVLIYPELEDHTKDFAWVLNDLFYPLAKYAQDKNANIFVRTKHTFWLGNVYLPMWEGLLSGKYADVFVPAMEETTDKEMDLGIAGRMGIWASGATNAWGARCVPDNASFDRSRQFSSQRLPNQFLRNMVYNIASGAQYLNNFPVDQDYMSVLWDLIAKGALYVPKTSEIVSFSPVHLSMKEPDMEFIDEGSNVKWNTFYNEEEEKNNPFVFSHLNGTWPGAPVTSWDFSNYASNVKDRRLNFLPSYSNGMVLITPPQQGIFAAKNPPRGTLTSHLNPIYKNILKEYYTDGRNYYSADGKQKFAANVYDKTIAADIKNSAKLLPLTVEGDVAWVVSQTSPTHLRLTLVDGGYLNPDNRKVNIVFHTVKPKSMTDLIDKTIFNVANPALVKADVACGLFRFIDIELTQPLN